MQSELILITFNRFKLVALSSRWTLWEAMASFVGGVGDEWYDFICPSQKNLDWLNIYNSPDRYQL